MSGNQQNRAWQAELIARYPALFDVRVGGRTQTPGFPTVEDGWRDLVERTVGRIAAALADAPSGSSLSVIQIKSKFGSLRLYWSSTGLTDETMSAVEEAVGLGEARSACTCEVCGAPGDLRDWNGWYATSCDEHAKGELVAVKPGRDNLHITKTVKDGRIRIATCRRYDRDADTFTDVDPSTLGVKE